MNELFNGSLISIAENKEDETKVIAKFLVCPLDVLNANKVGLREKDLTDEEKVGLVGEPLVCKVVKNIHGDYDFSGHNMKKFKEIDKDGNIVTRTDFDTSPIGYHTEMSIEEVELDGVKRRCFVATANIWKRYWRAIEVIERLGDSLRTSWEIGYKDFYIDKGGKWIRNINWLGNCVLGENVKPAYSSAGLLEVAEESAEMQLVIAFTEDLEQQGSIAEKSVEDINMPKGGNEMAENTEKVVEEIEATEQTQEAESVEETTTEESTQENEPNNEIEDSAKCGGNKKVKKAEEDEEDEEDLEDSAKCGDKKKKAKAEKETETSAMTMDDIYNKVREAINKDGDEYYYIVRLYPLEFKVIACKCWSDDAEDEMVEFTYVVDENEEIHTTGKRDVRMVFVSKDIYVSQSTELSEKVENIVKLGEIIQSKDTIISEKDTIIKEKETVISEKDVIISELEPFKAQIEEMQRVQREAELSEKRESLRKFALSSKYITEEDIETSEVIKQAIENLDEKAIKVAIAEKVIEVASNNQEIEVSETTQMLKKDLQMTYEYAGENPISAWLKKKNK